MDVEVHLGIPPYQGNESTLGPQKLTYTNSYTNEFGEPASRMWRVGDAGFLRLRYCDGMEFWLDRECTQIWALWPERSSIEDAASYLLGPVLGLVLRLRGVTCLHASAVCIGGRAVAFVGSAGAGKSTTAAALSSRGLAVLSDDIVALMEREDRFEVLPAYPHLSLWPESVDMLYGCAEALPRFIPNWEKRCLANGSRGLRFEERALPLGAIYILGDRRAATAPCVESLPAETAFLSLVANSYATKVLDRELRAREFHVLAQLLDRVPVRLLCPLEDGHRIDELCEAILSDFEILGSRKAIPARDN